MRIGLIGASRVATYAVIAAAKALADIEVVTVAARDPERARAYAEEHAIPRFSADYDALISDPEVDLVYIATPPLFHADQAMAAIAKGKPVLVEKPFAMSSAEAQRVFTAARTAAVPLFEAMHSPHHRLFKHVLKLIDDGAIGAVRHIEAIFTAPIDPEDPIRWNGELGGGALMDLGVYPLTWVRRIAGEEFEVSDGHVTMRQDVDESFAVRLIFPDGTTARIEASMAAPVAARLTVEGETGVIAVVNPVAPQRGHQLVVRTAAGERSETIEGRSSYEEQLLNIRASLQEGTAFPYPADDFVKSMEAIERIRKGWR